MASCANTAEQSRCCLGRRLGWAKEPFVRKMSRSPVGRGTFEGESVLYESMVIVSCATRAFHVLHLHNIPMESS